MTHEAGIEAAFNVFDRSGFFPHDSEIEAAIQAYLSASGMVLVPREPVAWEYWDGDSETGFDERFTVYSLDLCHGPGAVDCQGHHWVTRPLYAAAPDPFKS